jgi:hypothetical protein
VVELLGDFVDSFDLVAVQRNLGLEGLEVIGADNLRQERARRLKVFQAKSAEVGRRG